MNQTINQLFSLLDKWRHFPAYQLERRADIFFALYLPEILKYKYQHKADCIIPEFPVRRGSIYSDGKSGNKSVKIDYLSVDQSKKEVLLIELKTDLNSRSTQQDDYLQKAKDLNMPGLVDGIIEIYAATRQKEKYDYLLKELVELDWIEQKNKTLKNISTTYNIKVIYLQPTNESNNEHIISFYDVIKVLESKGDEFSKRFAQSLEEWKVNSNIKA